MKNFIFITHEGSTFKPIPKDYPESIENMQVIGFAKGENVKNAFENLIKEDSFLKGCGFDEVVGMELANSSQANFSIKCQNSTSR